MAEEVQPKEEKFIAAFLTINKDTPPKYKDWESKLISKMSDFRNDDKEAYHNLTIYAIVLLHEPIAISEAISKMKIQEKETALSYFDANDIEDIKNNIDTKRNAQAWEIYDVIWLDKLCKLHSNKNVTAVYAHPKDIQNVLNSLDDATEKRMIDKVLRFTVYTVHRGVMMQMQTKINNLRKTFEMRQCAMGAWDVKSKTDAVCFCLKTTRIKF